MLCWLPGQQLLLLLLLLPPALLQLPLMLLPPATLLLDAAVQWLQAASPSGPHAGSTITHLSWVEAEARMQSMPMLQVR